jgi:hypothetical protein
MSRWSFGDVVVRREVLGFGLDFAEDESPSWLRRPWAAIPVHVIDHDHDTLVAYIPPEAELDFVEGDWPTPDGRHPWHGRDLWRGHGVVMLHRRGEPYSVWHFWSGPERAFTAWYVNLQAPYAETAIGFDTQDFELDIVVSPDGTWALKDDDVLDRRVAEGRFRPEHAAWFRDVAGDITGQLDAGIVPWSQAWTDWAPPPGWRGTRLPTGWEQQG